MLTTFRCACWCLAEVCRQPINRAIRGAPVHPSLKIKLLPEGVFQMMCHILFVFGWIASVVLPWGERDLFLVPPMDEID